MVLRCAEPREESVICKNLSGISQDAVIIPTKTVYERFYQGKNLEDRKVFGTFQKVIGYGCPWLQVHEKRVFRKWNGFYFSGMLNRD